MRFSCESCQAKYAIPDERVEGKIVRLKCQKCGAEIVVKGAPRPMEAELRTNIDVPPKMEEPAPKPIKSAPVTRIEDRPAVRLDDAAFDTGSADEDEEEGRESTRIANLKELDGMRVQAEQDRQLPKQERRPPPPAPKVRAEWLVLVSGAQQGPFTEDDVRKKLAAGEVHARSYMWKDGMGDWVRMHQLPEFSDVPAPQAAAPKPAPPREPPVQKESSDFDSLFGKAGDPPKKELAPDKPPELEKPLELDPEPSGPVQMDEELSGPDATPPQSVDDSEAAVPQARVPEEASAPPRESTRSFMMASGFNDQKRQQRIILFSALAAIIIVGVLLLLDLLGVITLMAPDPTANLPQPASQPASQAVVDTLSEDEKTRLREGLLGKRKEEPKNETPPPSVAHGKAGDKKTQAAAPEEKPGAEQKMLADIYGDSAKSAVRVEAPTFKTAEQDLPSGINAEAITKVVESNQRAVKLCLERELKHGGQLQGKLEVEFMIAPSGMVTNADIKTAKFKGTEFGGCVMSAVKAWKFPRFSGEPVPVEYPFILSSGM